MLNENEYQPEDTAPTNTKITRYYLTQQCNKGAIDMQPRNCGRVKNQIKNQLTKYYIQIR